MIKGGLIVPAGLSLSLSLHISAFPFSLQGGERESSPASLLFLLLKRKTLKRTASNRERERKLGRGAVESRLREEVVVLGEGWGVVKEKRCPSLESRLGEGESRGE